MQLSNVSIFGSVTGYFGNASIMCHNSSVGVRDSTFIGIHGSLGAALMILESCVIFTGSDAFYGNVAAYGGSLYIIESVVILSGTNTFLNNTASEEILEDDYEDIDDSWDIRGSGGAIYCESSTLYINSEYSKFVNNFAEDSGGALVAQQGNITIQSSIVFENNYAEYEDGGAISLFGATLILNGNVLFINNDASNGGALSIFKSYLHLSEDWLNIKPFCVAATSFCWNMATSRGLMGSYSHNNILSCNNYSNYPFHNSIMTPTGNKTVNRTLTRISINDFIFTGMVEFRKNLAFGFGGTINSELSNIILDRNTCTYFDENRASDGGAIHLDSTSKLILSTAIKNVSFTNNYAENRGGALHIEDFECSTHSIGCFLSIYM